MFDDKEKSSSDSWNIEKPTTEDITQMLQLWEEQYRYHHGLDSKYYVSVTSRLTEQFRIYIQKAIEKDDPHILVAKDNDSVIGFMTYAEGKEEYFDTQITEFGGIKELFVDDNFRGKGIGRKLMKEAENYFASKGVEHIKLQVSSFNPGALKLYEELGYIERQRFLYKEIIPTQS